MRKEKKETIKKINIAKEFVCNELQEIYEDFSWNAVTSHGESSYEPEDQKDLKEIAENFGEYIFTFRKSFRPYVAAVIVATKVWFRDKGGYGLPSTSDVMEVLPIVKKALAKNGNLKELYITLVEEQPVLSNAKTIEQNRTFTDGYATEEEIFGTYVDTSYFKRRTTYKVPIF